MTLQLDNSVLHHLGYGDFPHSQNGGLIGKDADHEPQCPHFKLGLELFQYRYQYRNLTLPKMLDPIQSNLLLKELRLETF